MTTVDALKELYVSLGGEESTVSDVTTNAGMVEALANILKPGMLLPEVTEDDNGKTLKVVDGAWTASE